MKKIKSISGLVVILFIVQFFITGCKNPQDSKNQGLKGNISISGALQHEGLGPENTVPIVILTHSTQQKNITNALKEFETLDVLSGKPICIRIVDIPEDIDL